MERVGTPHKAKAEAGGCSGTTGTGGGGHAVPAARDTGARGARPWPSDTTGSHTELTRMRFDDFTPLVRPTVADIFEPVMSYTRRV